MPVCDNHGYHDTPKCDWCADMARERAAKASNAPAAAPTTPAPSGVRVLNSACFRCKGALTELDKTHRRWEVAADPSKGLPACVGAVCKECFNYAMDASIVTENINDWLRQASVCLREPANSELMRYAMVDAEMTQRLYESMFEREVRDQMIEELEDGDIQELRVEDEDDWVPADADVESVLVHPVLRTVFDIETHAQIEKPINVVIDAALRDEMSSFDQEFARTFPLLKRLHDQLLKR